MADVNFTYQLMVLFPCLDFLITHLWACVGAYDWNFNVESIYLYHQFISHLMLIKFFIIKIIVLMNTEIVGVLAHWMYKLSLSKEIIWEVLSKSSVLVWRTKRHSVLFSLEAANETRCYEQYDWKKHSSVRLNKTVFHMNKCSVV